MEQVNKKGALHVLPSMAVQNTEHALFCAGCGASQSVSTTSDMGVAPSVSPTTGERRSLGADEQFCHSCGEIVKKAAAICLKCGVRRSGSSEESSSMPMLLNVIIGLIGFQG